MSFGAPGQKPTYLAAKLAVKDPTLLGILECICVEEVAFTGKPLAVCKVEPTVILQRSCEEVRLNEPNSGKVSFLLMM